MPASPPRDISIARPSVGEEELEALREPISTGWLTQGPKVAEFERAFAERHGVSHAIATSSCTTALHLSLAALGVAEGHEVIVPAFTWVATANVVLHCGARPVFVDVDHTTFNIRADDVVAAITPRTKAIIPVHLFGLCAEMDDLREAAGEIPLVEDAACAAGAGYKRRPAGSLGKVGCFSFHPRKTITTGEGGMITTDDDALAERLISLRSHGASTPEERRHHSDGPYRLPDFNLPGYNYRMTDLQGAVGVVQLARLNGFIAERRQWAEYYSQELASVVWLRTPVVPEGHQHGWQAYVCYVDERTSPMTRDELLKHLNSQGIGARPGTHAVHMLGYYEQRFGLQPDDFPAARDCHQCALALPLHNRMSAEDYQYVVETIGRIT